MNYRKILDMYQTFKFLKRKQQRGKQSQPKRKRKMYVVSIFGKNLVLTEVFLKTDNVIGTKHSSSNEKRKMKTIYYITIKQINTMYIPKLLYFIWLK